MIPIKVVLLPQLTSMEHHKACRGNTGVPALIREMAHWHVALGLGSLPRAKCTCGHCLAVLEPWVCCAFGARHENCLVMDIISILCGWWWTQMSPSSVTPGLWVPNSPKNGKKVTYVLGENV